MKFKTTLDDDGARARLKAIADWNQVIKGSVKTVHNAAETKAVLTASRMDAYGLKRSVGRVTLTWTNATRCIQVQAGAAIWDRVSERVKGMAKAYARGLELRQPQPGPDGVRQTN